VTVLIGGCLQGWFPLKGLPWNGSLLRLAFLHDPNQPLMAPGFPSSSIGDEFKIHKIKEKH